MTRLLLAVVAWRLIRRLAAPAIVLAIDQKGDEQAEQMLRQIAAAGRRTFHPD